MRTRRAVSVNNLLSRIGSRATQQLRLAEISENASGRKGTQACALPHPQANLKVPANSALSPSERAISVGGCWSSAGELQRQHDAQTQTPIPTRPDPRARTLLQPQHGSRASHVTYEISLGPRAVALNISTEFVRPTTAANLLCLVPHLFQLRGVMFVLCWEANVVFALPCK